MIINNILLPLIIELILALKRKTQRMIDKRQGPFKLLGGQEIPTRCKSEQQYINLYAGPKFQIDFRYSRIMNIIFVTMMYGSALPILFPIACISFLVIYFLEIYLLFYVYQIPPNYDLSLHTSQIAQMEMASLLFLAFGTWFLSNN